MSVGRLFHMAHITEELDPLDAWYDRVFAPMRGIMQGNYEKSIRRMASMFVIGDAVIEAMAPSPEPEAALMPIGRFFAKFGSHWHSVAWYDDDVRTTWDRLAAQGIQVSDAGGRTEPPQEGDIYTHPKSTFTQLEFYQPQVASGGPQAPGSFADPRFEPGWAERWQASPNPLGVERMASVTILVPDLERATTVYCDGLGANLLDRGSSELTGTRSVFVGLGTETVVELAQPTDADCVAGRDLAAYPGGTCHAMTFTVADLEVVSAHLGQVGVSVLGRDETTIVADPKDSFGAPFRFTTERVPGDPRD
jgi:catechol 2,3-dioxygenase-like lactoylglutathione lyase family enzyme